MTARLDCIITKTPSREYELTIDDQPSVILPTERDCVAFVVSLADDLNARYSILYPRHK